MKQKINILLTLMLLFSESVNCTIITFADAKVKAICVRKWDITGDGELDTGEAAHVTAIGSEFTGNNEITSFDELKYFTGLEMIGRGTFSGCNNLTSVVIPENVEWIGDQSFYCKNLKKITIPKSVKKIEEGAFRCDDLSSIHITDLASWCGIDFGSYGSGNPLPRVKHFYLNDSEIIDLVIPEGVQKFGTAFRGCNIFTSVKIPNSVNTIENGAFSGCKNLTRIEIGDGVQAIGDNAFYNCILLPSVTIPGNVKSIGEEAFRDCQNLAQVNICNGVQILGYRAFEGCISLPSIEFPNSLEVIEREAFEGCEKLSKIVLGNGLKRVARAFPQSLTEVHISDLASWCRINFPDGGDPLAIAKHLYMDGKELRNAVIPEGVTSLGTGFSECLSLVSVTIPNSVKEINEHDFLHCTNLESVKIGDGVISIGKGAFGYCSSLKEVELGTALKTIGEEAFYQCSNLPSIMIPDMVVTIGRCAFENCYSLTEVSLGKRVKNIKEDAFRAISKTAEIIISDLAAWCNTNIEKYETNLQYYARRMFFNGEEIKNLIIPNTVKDFGTAFVFCKSIESVKIPISVETISDYAFRDCVNLYKIEIGEGVKSIGDGSFLNCVKLSEVHIVDVAAYCNIEYANPNSLIYSHPLYIARHLFMDGEEVEDLVIPNSVAGFGMAFRNCLSLKAVVIGNKVKAIEKDAFNGCGSLKEVDFADYSVLKEIKDEAFSGCPLVKVTLPSTLQSLGSGVFAYCDKLSDIYANMEYPFEILENVFTSTTYNNAVLHVISNKSAEKYRETFAWSKFFHIVKIGDEPGDGDGGKESDNYKKGGGGGGSITTRTYNYDITAQGKGNVVVDKKEESTGADKGWTSSFGGLNLRNEQKMVEIVHYPDSGVPFKFIPDAGYAVKQVQFCPEKDGTLKDVTNDIVFDSSISGYTYKAFDKDTGPKLVVTFEATTPDQPATSHIGDTFTEEGTEYEIKADGSVAIKKVNNDVSGSYTIPETITYNGSVYQVTSIGNNAFEGCTGLTAVSIPGSVNTIGDDAFSICDNLASITIGEGVRTIGSQAFYQCLALTTVTIPSSITGIGEYAFARCNLTSVISNIQTPFEISDKVFYYSTTYVDAILTVPADKVSAYRNTAGWKEFKNIKDVNGDTVETTNPQPTTLKDGDAFEATVGETTFTIKVLNASDKTCQIGADNRGDAIVSGGSNWDGVIPSKVNGTDNQEYTVIGIGNRAFFEDGGIVTLILPESLLQISEGAFMRCENLMYVTIPAGLKTVEGLVFNGQEVLTEVISLIEDPQTLNGTLDFGGRNGNNATLIVPAGKVSAYRNTPGWDSFKIIKDVNGNTDEPQPEEPQPEPQPEGLKVGDAFIVYIGEVMNTYVLTSENTVNLNKWGVNGSSRAEIPSKVTYEDVEYTITGILGTATGNPDQPNMPVFGSNVTEVIIPNTVTSIGACAFWYCENLASVSIPNSVTVIGDNAFLGSALNSVTIPASVNTIGEYAFTSCFNLTKVVAEGETPVNISGAPRFNLDILQTAILYVPSGTAAVYQNAGWNFTNIVEDGGTTPEPQPEPEKEFTDNGATYTIGDDHTATIDFVDNLSGSYEVPEKVVHNGAEYQLVGVSKGAFENQVNLTEITIPRSIVSIGENAFAGCVNLKAIYIYAAEPANLATATVRTRAEAASSVFEGVDKETCVLYVPKGCVERYRAAEGWGEFTHIEEMDGTGISSLTPDRNTFDVYDMSGRKVRTAATSLDGLPNSIYIVNGKKVMK